MNLRGLGTLALGTALLSAAGPARAEGEYDLWLEYQRAGDAQGRNAAVAKLAKIDTEISAKYLSVAALDDAALEVRITAIEGLGRSTSKSALDLLVDVVESGGVQPARRAAATAVARQTGGVERLKGAAAARDASPAVRGLALAALGEIRSPAARGALCGAALSADPVARVEAMRALATLREGRDVLGILLADVLAAFKDTETVLCALDLAELVAAKEVRAAGTGFGTHADPDVRAAAAAVLERLDYLDAEARRRPKAADGPYATPPGSDPLPVPPRVRLDVVYAYDATGSIAGFERWLAGQVLTDVEVLRRTGASVRVGVVAFRDRLRDANSVRSQVLPLTYARGRVGEFLDTVRAEGVDSQGTDIGLALAEAMDRMSWRWNARRNVVLVADSKVGDPDRARRVAALHLADRTRLDVLYLRRTRGRIPESVLDLGRVVGTTVRVIDDVPDLPRPR